eukprot:GHVP01022458.1.p1 GENE.GHVP01022458.1~~GHVP01022458.1.p1  ORF type:complete len:152 (+),score=11.56 GHVP01022458.1:309-764(+)
MLTSLQFRMLVCIGLFVQGGYFLENFRDTPCTGPDCHKFVISWNKELEVKDIYETALYLYYAFKCASNPYNPDYAGMKFKLRADNSTSYNMKEIGRYEFMIYFRNTFLPRWKLQTKKDYKDFCLDYLGFDLDRFYPEKSTEASTEASGDVL